MADELKVTTLWDDCLIEAMEEARGRGESVVEFSKVDKLVIEKSHEIMEYTTVDKP